MKQPQPQSKSNNYKNSMIALSQGRITPQATDIEEAVLGALMVDTKGINEIIDKLIPEAFYKEAHQHIFRSIKTLFEDNQPVDLISVSTQLKKDGKLEVIGGEYYLIELTQRVVSSAHLEFHTHIILQKHIQRSLITISNDIINEAYDDSIDVFDLLDDAEAKLYEVTQGNIKKSTEVAKDLVRQAIAQIEENSKKEGFSGIATGFDKLDAMTSGWQPSDLIIIAARPGMGKTAFVLTMARNIAVDYGHAVAVFSLEMSSVQLITRLISAEANLESEKLRSGKLEDHEWQQLSTRVNRLEKAPLFIDDTPSLSILELRAKARRLKQQHDIKLLIVDYLQLMTAGGSNKGPGNREQEISTISRNLKGIAKELDIPVIALSQLSRQVENRGSSKRPLLSDLRESGAIEQDADIVSFIYRPEYYDIDTWDDDDQSPTAGQAEFIIAKHRNGGLGNIRMSFIGKFGKFANLDSHPFSSEFSSKMNSVDEIASSLPDASDVFTEDQPNTDIPSNFPPSISDDSVF